MIYIGSRRYVEARSVTFFERAGLGVRMRASTVGYLALAMRNCCMVHIEWLYSRLTASNYALPDIRSWFRSSEGG